MKKVNIIFLFALIIINADAQVTSLEWAKSFGGMQNEIIKGTTFDAEGNTYITGTFNGTADFDPGVGVYNLQSTTGWNGSTDIFITKLNSAGKFIWAKQFQGIFDENVTGIAVDTFGNVFTTGSFNQSVDFDPDTIKQFNLIPDSNEDMFICKLDSSGNFVWAKKFGGWYNQVGNRIVLDIKGNVYTTGYFEDKMQIDSGTGVFTLTSLGSSDIFVMKLSNSGNFIWAKSMGGTSNDIGYAITIDSFCNVYTTGKFFGTADFDPDAAVYKFSEKGGYGDMFISKLNVNGKFIWAKHIRGLYTQSSESIILDGEGNVYTSGRFLDSTDFDPGNGYYYLSCYNTNLFILKLDNAGNFKWVKSIIGNNNTASASITDKYNNVYTVGYFTGQVDFDPGLRAFQVTGSGMFILKLSSSGNFKWVKTILVGLSAAATSVRVDESDNIKVSGIFSGKYPVDFDPGNDTLRLKAVNESQDIFVMKMKQGLCVESYTNFNISVCQNYTSPSLKYLWKSSAIVKDTIPNYLGCDSIMTFHLTVDSINLLVTKNGNNFSAIEPDAIYQWLDCNANKSRILNATSQTFTATKSGSYAVEIKKKSCMDTSNCFNINISGITNPQEIISLTVKPNPSSGLFTIFIPGKNDNLEIEINNIIGSLIYKGKVSNGEVVVDLSNQVEGLYIIKVVKDNLILNTQRIIVRK